MTSNGKPKLENNLEQQLDFFRAASDYDYSPCQLSDEQVDFYWKNGYLVVKKLYDAGTLNLFKDRFVEICNAPAANRATITNLYSIVKDPSLYKKDANPETYINKEYRKAMTAHYAKSSCHFIDVKGTTQEYVAKVIEQELKRRGGEIDFVDFWKIKSKQVAGVRSHL